LSPHIISILLAGLLNSGDIQPVSSAERAENPSLDPIGASSNELLFVKDAEAAGDSCAPIAVEKTTWSDVKQVFALDPRDPPRKNSFVAEQACCTPSGGCFMVPDPEPPPPAGPCCRSPNYIIGPGPCLPGGLCPNSPSAVWGAEKTLIK